MKVLKYIVLTKASMDARYHISERQLGQCPCHSKWNLTGDWKKEHTQIFDIAISHRFGQVLSVKQHEGGGRVK